MGLFESQLEARARYDDEMVNGAYAALANGIDPQGSRTSGPGSGSDRMSLAVAACLRCYGAEAGDVPEEAEEGEKLHYLCRPSGTMHRAVRLEKRWYRQTFGPMLGRLDTGESVALLPKGFQGYVILDPETGKRTRVNAKTAARIAPEAVFFYRALPSHPITVRELMAFITRCPSTVDYLTVFLAALAATLIGFLPAWANALAFGTVIPAGRSDLIPPIAALLTGVAVSTLLISAIRNLIMHRIALKAGVYTEAAMYSRLLSLPSSFFRRYTSGSLAVRIANMKDLAEQLVMTSLGSGLTCLLCLIYLIQIVAFAPSLAIPALFTVLIQSALLAVSTWLNVRYEKAKINANAELSGTVTSLLNGIQKIKLAGAENRAFTKWSGQYANYARPAYGRPGFLQALPACVGAVGLLGGILIFAQAAQSGVHTADYMAFNVAYGQMSAAILSAAGLARQVVQIRPIIDLIVPILSEEPERTSGMPMVQRVTGAVEVSNVSFRYDEKSPYVLKNVSLSVKPGEYVAIVGRSGSGKSTLVRLLLGFEKPEKGSVFYDVNDLAKVDAQSLRRKIGSVTQNGRLFVGNIYYNIIVSAPQATLDDAWAAAELSGIAEDIRNMPMGMQTLISESGSGLSGGQRQRLLIARAICGKPKILIMDEATSALDNLAQKHVADSLEQMKCTRIVIAHRLSTIQNCNHIFCLDQGRIVEEGSYAELMAKKGFFADLVARQRIDPEE